MHISVPKTIGIVAGWTWPRKKKNGEFRFDLLVVGSHDFAYRFGSVIVINGADEKKTVL